MVMVDPGLKDRVILITGCNNPSGIGAAAARAFAAQGARVFLHGFRPLTEPASGAAPETPGAQRYRALQAHPVAALVQQVRQAGGVAEACEADFSEPDAVPACFDAAETAFGPVEVVVNSAAHDALDTFLPRQAAGGPTPSFGEPTPLTAASHDRHFAVNSRAVALIMMEFARRALARGERRGCIVNVSTDGASGHAGAVSYGASKHALESFSRAAAYELGPYGITVNVVAPGPVQTGWIDPGLEEQLIPAIPLRRIGTPEEVADAILFFASEQARWMTGQLLYVGGGHVMPL